MRSLPALVAVLLVATALSAGAAPAPTSTPAPPATDAVGPAAPPGSTAGSLASAPVPADAAPAPAPTAAPPPQVDPDPAAQVNASNASAADEPLRVLDLPSTPPARSALHARSVDVGPSLGFAANATATRLETMATLQYVRDAETGADRQRRVVEAVATLEREAAALRVDQREAIRAYVDGRTDADDLLVSLARIDARAAALDDRRAAIEDLAAASDGVSLADERVPAITTELRTYDGPVRERLVAVLRGEAPPTRFYVAASESGVVLSAIVDDDYLRETYRFDLRSDGTERIGLDDALDNVTATAYPIAWQAKTTADAAGSGGSLVVRVPHARGDLTAFVDGGSRRVYREVQRRPLDSFYDNRTATGIGDGLRLTVNRTYAGGPMRVELVDIATDAPRDLLVTVRPPQGDSIQLGRTGPDGVLWTLTPAGQFTVATFRTTDDPTFVTTPTISAARPPSVHAGPADGGTAGPTGDGSDSDGGTGTDATAALDAARVATTAGPTSTARH